MKVNELFEGRKYQGYKPFKKEHEGWKGGTNPVRYEGEEYFFTGKTGTNRKSKKLSFEYSNSEDARIWVTDDGEIQKD